LEFFFDHLAYTIFRVFSNIHTLWLLPSDKHIMTILEFLEFIRTMVRVDRWTFIIFIRKQRRINLVPQIVIITNDTIPVLCFIPDIDIISRYCKVLLTLSEAIELIIQQKQQFVIQYYIGYFNILLYFGFQYLKQFVVFHEPGVPKNVLQRFKQPNISDDV